MSKTLKQCTTVLLALVITMLLVFTGAISGRAASVDFTEGRTPLLLPQAFEALYGLKGLLSGGSATESLLILHKGKLVYESYAEGWDKDTPHEIWSATKSVVATLAGVAIQDGYIEGIDQKVMDFIGEIDPAVSPQDLEYLQRLTIEHLLTMTSGIYICDGYESSPNKINISFHSPPGTVYNYENGGITFLGAVISMATGRPLLEYAWERLFKPLGITSVIWSDLEKEDGGYLNCGYGIEMTPRDMLRLGYLYMNYGRWEDRQIFSPAWAAQAGPKSMAPQAYGYTFWNNELLPFFGFYEATGMLGQFISIYPAWDMVVVRTGDMGQVDEFINGSINKLINTKPVRLLLSMWY